LTLPWIPSQLIYRTHELSYYFKINFFFKLIFFFIIQICDVATTLCDVTSMRGISQDWATGQQGKK
jgi:hypothetical protein